MRKYDFFNKRVSHQNCIFYFFVFHYRMWPHHPTCTLKEPEYVSVLLFSTSCELSTYCLCCSIFIHLLPTDILRLQECRRIFFFKKKKLPAYMLRGLLRLTVFCLFVLGCFFYFFYVFILFPPLSPLSLFWFLKRRIPLTN